MKKNDYFKEIEKIYKEIKPQIEKRLQDFKNVWDNGTNEDVHLELSFCILTPQSKAINAWKAITNLNEKGLIFKASAEEMVEYLNIVRFKNNKAKYLVELREQMTDKDSKKIITKDFFSSIPDIFERRNWIVKNIKGMSYKEAGHFLRNVGFGQDLAILDRHILKNLQKLEVIEDIPKTLNPKLYLEIEKKMRKYCESVKIPMDEMDILLWYKEVGEIFK
ncbi:MAG: N-glycosylase/DNA lyase [Fusobacterium sp.]|uniref:N-glycosylase/DNA lyase n=1 Tax=Fusobacterium sp. TaxID=68766 RepID=UPI0026DD1CCB|nr:N-glycosylase/DNA lyase [Fusobacterium sp.]MDO4690630.1 N-glycosylase/DNA lyase [Fusobacterium sp.]